MIRLAIRGYIRGVKQFQERMSISESGDELEGLAEKHALAMLARPGGDKHMIEIEFRRRARSARAVLPASGPIRR